MLLIYFLVSLEADFRTGVLLPSGVTEHYFGAIYNFSASTYFSPNDFSYGLYGDLYYKRHDPYTEPYFQNSGLSTAVRAGNIGGTVRYRMFTFVSVKGGVGYCFGQLLRPRALANAAVEQEKISKNSLAAFIAWDLSKKVGPLWLGGELKVNLISFGSKSTSYYYDPYYDEYDPFNEISLTGVAFSIEVGIGGRP